MTTAHKAAVTGADGRATAAVTAQHRPDRPAAAPGGRRQLRLAVAVWNVYPYPASGNVYSYPASGNVYPYPAS